MKAKVLFLCSVCSMLLVSGCSSKPDVVKKPIAPSVGSCNMSQQTEYKTVPFE